MQLVSFLHRARNAVQSNEYFTVNNRKMRETVTNYIFSWTEG